MGFMVAPWHWMRTWQTFWKCCLEKHFLENIASMEANDLIVDSFFWYEYLDAFAECYLWPTYFVARHVDQLLRQMLAEWTYCVAQLNPSITSDLCTKHWRFLTPMMQYPTSREYSHISMERPDWINVIIVRFVSTSTVIHGLSFLCFKFLLLWSVFFKLAFASHFN